MRGETWLDISAVGIYQLSFDIENEINYQLAG